jgi:nucleoside-diphosphate-sugar epimerase
VERLRQFEGVSYTVAPLTRRDLDLANRVAVDQWFSANRSDAVVHLASSLDRRATDEASESQWRDTFCAGRNVVESAARHGVHHLIAAGSLDELGPAKGRLGTARRAAPVTTYGLCKNLVREVAEFATRKGTFMVDWMRPFVVYGPGQRGSMLVPAAFEAASNGTIAEFSDGRQQRDFVFVDDVVDWVISMIESNTSSVDPAFRMHHLGSAVATPVREVIAGIRSLFPAADLRLGAIARRAGEPFTQVATSPISPTPVELSEGLMRTASWWRIRGDQR